MTGPLDGVLVADFSRVLSAPLATMFLADLGADVIKVERPGAGDDTRQWGPPYWGDQSTYFLAANRNKRSVALDLRTDRGRKAALTLAARADVVVENFRPGTMDSFGLGYEAVREPNPRVVYCSVSGYGSGAGRDRSGYDFAVQAAGGLMSITGPADGEPTKVGVALVDVLTGLHAVIGVQAALYERRRTGRGRHVEVNLLSSLLASLANQASAFLCTGEVPGRLGNDHPSIAPYQLVRTATRPVALAVGNDVQFRALAHAFDADDLAADPRFATNRDRVANRGALDEALAGLLSAFDADEVIARCAANGVPATPVNDLAQAFALAEELGLDPVAREPESGWAPQAANPIRFDGEIPAYRLPPPRLGEHDNDILRWLDTMEENPMTPGAR
ncbi:CoA transferase [Actinoallomurus oryzae]|uniref:CoA transferase n=1 Tax=Actinoallomurus oryzae TaxID=502180 RepID=A0ABP8PVA1_9ACTN